jgi:hypothetical protein
MHPPLHQGPVALNEADLLDAGPSDAWAHNLALVYELIGALDLDRLAAAYRWLAARHESFRTSFVRVGASWERRVQRESAFELEIFDLTGEADPEAAARARIAPLLHTPFDRSRAPLLRVLLLRLGPARQWVLNLGDHVVLDGVSFATATAELMLAYLTLEHGEPPELPPARQPREHHAAVEAALAPLRAASGPWSTPYPPNGFMLPPDPPLPGGPDPAGARLLVDLGDPAPADAVARALGVSRSAPLLVAMALGLRAITGRADPGFTLIRSGRRDAAARAIVGCLAWGDAWGARIEPGEPFAALLRRAQAFLEDAHPGRMLTIPLTSPPTRRVVLNINRYETSLDLPGLTIFPRVEITADVRMWSSHDLLVQIFPLPGAMFAALRYRTSLLSPATVERLGAAMAEALRAMAADPNAPVP